MMEQGIVVDLSEIFALLVNLALAAAAPAGAWLIRRVLQKLKLDRDARIRDYLDQALKNGLGLAAQIAAENGQNIGKVVVQNAMIADAMTYAKERVPDALTHFGITEAGLAEMVKARLGASEEIPLANQPPAPAVAPTPVEVTVVTPKESTVTRGAKP